MRSPGCGAQPRALTRVMLSLQANTITYSALIGACSTSGRWQEAENVFTEMLEAAQDDSECRPNTITYRCGSRP